MILKYFTPISKSTISELSGYFTSLKNLLADLNATMMVAWQDVLGLNYYIDNQGILFVYGKFNDQFQGWSPPLGKNAKISHVNLFLDFLDKLNGKSSSILYLWKDYPLYDKLCSCGHFSICDQGSEYIYSSKLLASLSPDKMKSFRKKRDYFYRKYRPETKSYSIMLANDCMKVLDNWIEQKKTKVPAYYKEKFAIEASVCRNAIIRELPMTGVVIYVEGRPVAFSIGGEHTKEYFNCMFEKTDLSMNGLSIVVFSELGRCISKNYPFVNAGEDWGVSYLKKTKLKWQPIQIQKSFKLSRNIQ